MRLYLSAETNIPDVYIDFLEVQLQNGQEVSLTWDESDISRREGGFDARYKGVYFDEEYANGRIGELQGMEITHVGLYYETDGNFQFRISDMEFEDFELSLSFENPTLPATLREELSQTPQSFDARLQSAISKSNTDQVTQNREPERGS